MLDFGGVGETLSWGALGDDQLPHDREESESLRLAAPALGQKGGHAIFVGEFWTEQWKKPWLVVWYRGWNTTQFDGDCKKNHYKDPY